MTKSFLLKINQVTVMGSNLEVPSTESEGGEKTLPEASRETPILLNLFTATGSAIVTNEKDWNIMISCYLIQAM